MPRGKKIFPKYVETYNEILTLIRDGFYPEDSKLPPEEELAVQMKVSRMTLRQALLLLKEDGIIESKHGSGNYVKQVLNQEEVGLEERGNPIRHVCASSVEETELSLELRPTTEYVHQMFGRRTAVGLDVRRFYKSEARVVAYSLSTMLTDVMDEFVLNLNQEEEIRNFLETGIYEDSHRVRLEAKILPENHGMKEARLGSDSGMYLVMFEQIYNQQGSLLVFTKYYMGVEDVRLLMNWHRM